MDKSKNILILAYKFFPAGGVGTRRWIKFCKFLVSSGYQVHIITGKFSARNNNNAWANDLNGLKGLTLHPTGGKIIPNLIFSNKRTKLEKILSYPLRAYLKLCTSYIDYAEPWGKSAIPMAQKLIYENNIKNIIATGAPFSTLISASTLKIQNPQLNFIADLRDPWIEDYNNLRYPQRIKTLEEFNKNYKYQLQVFNCADHITTVSKTLKKMFIKNFSISPEKVHYTPNGFDPKIDIPTLLSDTSENINILYPGALTGNRMEAINYLQESLLQLESQGVGIRLKFHFIGSSFPLKRDHFKKYFIFYPYMNSEELNKFSTQMDFGLVINSKGFSYLYSSKAAEYIGKRLPLILVSEEGELSEITSQINSYHINYDKDDFKNKLKEINNLTKKMKIDKKNPFYNHFNIVNLTEKITDLFV